MKFKVSYFMKNISYLSIAIFAFIMVSCNSNNGKKVDAKSKDSLSRTVASITEADDSTEVCCAEDSEENCDGTGDEKSTCCSDEKEVSVKENNSGKAASKLIVYAFHGTRQCSTCKNMKSHTKEALEAYFSDKLKSGEIQFLVVDVDDPKNEAIAEKFEATGTALMVNRVVDGKEHISDWSEFAFDKANDKDEFMPEFKKLIEKELK